MKFGDKWQYTDEEKQSICEFARRITPPNWNIFSDSYGEIKNEHRTVNVCFQFVEDCGTLWKKRDPSFIGTSGYANGCWMIEGVHGTNIILQSPWKAWKGLVIHELAHIAVYRWTFYSTKEHMKQIEVKSDIAGKDPVNYMRGGNILSRQPPMHGKIFKRALAVMRKRAKNCRQ
jgi:hypothetical protein